MEKTPAPDASGARAVGRYQLVSRVVSGALGELWRGRIASGPEQGRVVLVRLIPRGSAADAKAVERLTNAGFATMELRHAKIAAVLDVVVADSEIAIVSEHIPGAALQSVARQTGPKRALPTPALALRIVADVLEALDAVRAPWAELTADPQTDDERLLARGIHGGLTLDDVFVASFGESMLLESGLAGVAMTLPAISDHPDVIAYRAPEQIEAKEPIDERADIFTVGVIAWELVTGRSLFGPMLLARPLAGAPGSTGVQGGPVKLKPLAEAAQTSSVKRKVLQAPIQRLDSMPLLKGKVTKELASFVSRCLERDRAARFQTLREALTELHALGPSALGATSDVAKWLAASGLSLDLPETTGEPAPVPPVEEAARRGPVGDSSASSDEPPTAPAIGPRGGAPTAANLNATARMRVVSPFAPAQTEPARGPSDVANLTVESLMPSDSVPPTSAHQEEPESVPSSSLDVESIPPSSADAPTLPPVSRDASSSADVESIPPSSSDLTTLPPGAPTSSTSQDEALRADFGPDVESVPPSMDVESVPPSTDVESMPPSTDVESVPPSGMPLSFSEEVTLSETLPPFSTESTMISAVPREGGTPAVSATPGASATPIPNDVARGAFPRVAPVATEEPTAGAVVRALEKSAATEYQEYPEYEEGPRLHDPSARRRAANRRIVEYVMGGAAAVIVAAVIAVLVRRHGETSAEQSASEKTTAAPAVSAVSPDPSARAAVLIEHGTEPSRAATVEPSAAAGHAVTPPPPAAATVEPQRGEASAEPTIPLPPEASPSTKPVPTSAPMPAAPVQRAEPTAPKPAGNSGNRKRAYRPTGI